MPAYLIRNFGAQILETLTCFKKSLKNLDRPVRHEGETRRTILRASMLPEADCSPAYGAAVRSVIPGFPCNLETGSVSCGSHLRPLKPCRVKSNCRAINKSSRGNDRHTIPIEDRRGGCIGVFAREYFIFGSEYRGGGGFVLRSSMEGWGSWGLTGRCVIFVGELKWCYVHEIKCRKDSWVAFDETIANNNTPNAKILNDIWCKYNGELIKY